MVSVKEILIAIVLSKPGESHRFSVRAYVRGDFLEVMKLIVFLEGILGDPGIVEGEDGRLPSMFIQLRIAVWPCGAFEFA